MAFSSGILNTMQITGSGELYDPNTSRVYTAGTFESGLKVGHFAKMDTGSLDNMDGSATPVIAGVVLRNVANTFEDGATITTDLHDTADVALSGLIAVEAKAGETPTWGEAVYASNAGDANDGKATVTNTDEATRGIYLETLGTNLWLIELV